MYHLCPFSSYNRANKKIFIITRLAPSTSHHPLSPANFIKKGKKNDYNKGAKPKPLKQNGKTKESKENNKATDA